MRSSLQASVIICVKNGQDFLRRQLDAVTTQVTNPRISYEIIVVDNGSTDGTPQVIQEWLKTVRANGLIKTFSQPHLKGIPTARNFAAQQAEGDLLLFCDADDEVSDSWVQAYIDRLNGQEALAGGLIEAYDSAGVAHPGFFPHSLIQTTYLPHVVNCNCAVSRSIFFAVGGYDQSLPTYGFEDVDFSWRVHAAGFPIIFVEEARIWFQISGSTASFRKKFLLGKGRVLMARRYPSYDSETYSVGYCTKKIIRVASEIIHRFRKERTFNRRELSVLVASFGNLYGALFYSGKNRQPAPELLPLSEV